MALAHVHCIGMSVHRHMHNLVIPAILSTNPLLFSLCVRDVQVWYSPLMFNSACEKLAHGGKPQKLSKPGMIASALGTATAMPFFCLILSVAGCRSALEGALWGAAFGLFFDTGLNCSHSFFEERPFGLFLIHSGCHAVSLTVIGAILGQLCA